MSSNIYTSIRLRMIAIIKAVSSEDRRFKSLEEATHISGATWRTFWNRESSPSGEMIESISECWPKYAFWLATGGTDPSAGHIAPPDAEFVLEKINEPMQEAEEYFQYQMELLSPIRARSRAAIEKIGVTPEVGKRFELWNEEMQAAILQLMPPGSSVFVSEAEGPPGTLSKEYEQARDEFMRQKRQQNLLKLEELRERKVLAMTVS